MLCIKCNIIFICNTGNTDEQQNIQNETTFTEAFTGANKETLTRSLLMSETNRIEGIDLQPSLTFLTHGLGANASIWSNDGTSFQYDPDSLIESLRNNTDNAVVYLAQVCDKVEDDYIFKLWELVEGQYNYSSENGNYITQFDIEDISKHIIVVFENRQGEFVDELGNVIDYNLQGLNNAYAEFDYVVDTLLYEIKQLSGILPKINLLGHNTGGLSNLMYAIEHPKNVSSLFSVGTPFNGLTGDAINLTKNWISEKVMNSPGMKDLLDEEFITNLRSRWNEISLQNYDINNYALGSATGYDIIENFIEEDSFQNLTFWGSRITINDLKSVFNSMIEIIK